MNEKLRYIASVFILFCACSLLASEKDSGQTVPSKKIDIYIGQSVDIIVKAEFQIHVSKRGVVDIKQLDERTWRLTALKADFVVINIFKDSSYTEKISQYFVYSIRDKSKSSLFAQAHWKDNICGQKGFVCNELMRSLDGEISDYKFFLYVRQRCAEEKECYFQAVLSDLGASSYADYLRLSLDDADDVKVHRSGLVYVFVDCSENKEERKFMQKRLASLSERTLFFKLQVRCSKNNLQARYKIKAKLILLSDSAMKELGLDVNYSLDKNQSSKSFLSSQLSAKLKAFQQSKNISVIAEPSLVLLSDKVGKIKSGGEFFVQNRNSQSDNKATHNSDWKEHGMSFKASVIAKGSKKVNLTYSMAVRSPSSSRELTLHSMNSSIEILLDEEVFVGGALFRQKSSAEDGVPYLNKIPIIGPIFKLNLNQEAQTHLYMSVVVEKLN